MKKETFPRLFHFSWIFALIFLFFALSSCKTIFVGAANFLAPTNPEGAEVVILTGEQEIRAKGLEIGIAQLSSGMAKRFVIVLHEGGRDGREGFAPLHRQFLTWHLETMGVKEGQFEILEVPTKHPITLNEARIVLSGVSKMGFTSAVVLAEGFHTRRSFWTYREMGKSLGIKVTPHAYFTRFQNDSWWQTRAGVRSFLLESMKLLYYFISGYIPLHAVLGA
jgi:hypothetical protein